MKDRCIYSGIVTIDGSKKFNGERICELTFKQIRMIGNNKLSATYCKGDNDCKERCPHWSGKK